MNLTTPKRLTKRAPDAGILRQSQVVFYALAFFWLDGFAVPAPAQVTQTVGRIDYTKEINMNTSDYLGIIGIVVGAILSYYFYRKSIREKEPVWSIKSNNLVQELSSQLSGVDVTYKGKSVPNLTISKLMFWNAGTEIINSSDITTSNPVRITITNAKFLDASVLQMNNSSSEFDVKIDDASNTVFIHFDYLNHLDGAVVQLIHTGISSSCISVEGAIKGVKSIHKYTNSYTNRTFYIKILNRLFQFKRSVLLLFALLFTLVATVIMFLPTSTFNPLQPANFKQWGYIGTGVFYILGSFYIVTRLVRIWGSKFPNNLDKFMSAD